MYTTCLHCHHDLGRNESIELFPVGRRLAFDQAKGRLWVICTTCARWNLSPLEERWEAIEQCERAYRDTRKRVATEQMGLAKVGDGLTLVRIGKPVFPEYAGWRYGERFVQRRTRYRILKVASVVAGVATIAAFHEFSVLVLGGGGGYFGGYQIYSGYMRSRREGKLLGTLPDAAGGERKIRGWEANAVRLLPSQGDLPMVELDGIRSGKRDKKHTHVPFDRFVGTDARNLLRMALPHINREGAKSATVASAIRLLNLADGPADPLAVARLEMGHRGHAYTLLREVPHQLRVGLEIAVMEDQERRWLESELYLLAASWQEAEKLAAIADSLTLPEWVSEKLGRLRGSDGPATPGPA